MPLVNRIANFHAEMTEWRHAMHAHPETAFEEVWTSDFVANKLSEFGYTVHRGLAGTGVVGTIKGNKPDTGRAIGLRADMDALNLVEGNTFAHRSQIEGKMHGCGHDGHMTMLLGAAKYLAETRNFAGTVHLIFQPAEEGAGGGRRMVEEGLFEKFPVEAVYGMHNMPGILSARSARAQGQFFLRWIFLKSGSMASAPMPQPPSLASTLSWPPLMWWLLCKASSAAKSTLSRPLFVTITEIKAGTGALNTIPTQAVMRGTARILSPAVRDMMEARLRRVVAGVAAAYRASAEIDYRQNYPPTITDPAHTQTAVRVAEEIAGIGKVNATYKPNMASEDFSFMLQRKPGAYIFIGNGPEEGNNLLHNPGYDFNDDILPLGSSYWSRLVETVLA